MPARSFRDLIVWQRGMDLAVAVYAATRSFPPEERFGLTSQMRRSAVSEVSNVAEGVARGNAGDFARCLGIAKGSNAELQTQLLLAQRLGLGSKDLLEPCEALSAEVQRLLIGLMKMV